MATLGSSGALWNALSFELYPEPASNRDSSAGDSSPGICWRSRFSLAFRLSINVVPDCFNWHLLGTLYYCLISCMVTCTAVE